MFSSLLITFRETLEAALVVGIVLTFLTKTNQLQFKKFVWQGVGAGIITAILLAFGIEFFFGAFEGRTEELFEGILMFVTAGFLTWMILWIHRQKDVAKKLKEKVAEHAKKGYGIGILLLVATSVFREGTETVLYLKATSLIGMSGQLAGAAIGIGLALLLGYALFRWALRINLQLVFTVTSVFLIMFAAGLVSHGIHEFQELGIVPVYHFDPLINMSAILDHNSTFGSFLRTLFGYTSKPTLMELASYAFYIIFILWLQKTTTKALSKRTT